MPRFFNFVKHNSLREILLDKKLAKLGDSYINFIYSIANSKKKNEPTNERVSSVILAESLKRAGLREYLPNRIDRHDQGDAVEALLVYTWLYDIISLEESVDILADKADVPVEAFSNLIEVTMKRLGAMK